MIFIIDDDPEFAQCIKLSCRSHPTRLFSNSIDAISALDSELPDLIFLDILLDGPDGFTFLNEISSYSDSAKIPIVIISSLDLSGQNLADYGVVGVLDKSTLRPADIENYLKEYLPCPNPN